MLYLNPSKYIYLYRFIKYDLISSFQFRRNNYYMTVYCQLVYLTYMQDTSCKMLGWMNHKLGIMIAWRNISKFRCVDGTTLMTESEEQLKSLLVRVKKGSEKESLKSTWCKELTLKKDPDAGKRRQKKGMAEHEMVRQHHWLNGHEFEQISGDSEGQRSLARCRPWGCKELDMN